MRRLFHLMIATIGILTFITFFPENRTVQSLTTGGTWTPQTHFHASDRGRSEGSTEFGISTSISSDGKIALIGAQGDTRPGAYIYLWNAGRWIEQKLICTATYLDLGFCSNAVALSSNGDVAVVASKWSNRVVVYVRNGSTWYYRQTLTSAPNTPAHFGYAVAISGDGNTILIGDTLGDGATSSASGVGYVYIRNGTSWILQHRFDSYPNQTTHDIFGFAVALSADGNVALITAQGQQRSSNPDRGWAYFFTRTNGIWSSGQEVTGSSSIFGTDFGWSVALSADGDTAIIGAPHECSCSGSHFGATYIFTRSGSTWTEQQRLSVSDFSTRYFGGSVALSADGNTVAIGTQTEFEGDGKVYLFTRSQNLWIQRQKLLSPQNPTNSFGVATALSADGSNLLIGSFYGDGGTAYLYGYQSDTTTLTPTPSVTPYPAHPGVYYNGVFYLRESNTAGNADLTVAFGGDASDLPIAGDWNGDGISTIGVYRSSSGQFFLSDSNTAPNVRYAFTFGNPDDAPLAGRWDDQITRDGVGVYRNSNGILYLKDYLSTGFSDYFAIYGNPGDSGVAGDWDGDGFDSVGIYRPSAQMWYLTNNHTPSGITFSDLAFVNSIGTAQPITGDWDADQISTTGYYFATVSGVFSQCIQNVAPAGCNTFGFGPAGGRGVTGYWGLTISPAPQYQILQPAVPTRHFSGDSIDLGKAD